MTERFFYFFLSINMSFELATNRENLWRCLKGYGAQSAEEKQRLFKLMRNLNFSGESGSEPYTPTAQNSGAFAASDGIYFPEFRGDFGAGLLDLHSMDDTELLSDVHINIWLRKI